MASEEKCFLMETLGSSVHFFVISGLVAVSYVSLKLLMSAWTGVKTFFLSPSMGLGLNLKKLGEWAVVTGATDGIGKAYAHELARKGMNVVLVSRTKAKLDDVAKEIEGKHSGVKTKVIAVDFTKTDIYTKITKELAGMEIGVLVNNVGMGYSYPEFFNNFTEKDDEMLINMITCNMTSLTMMTRIILPAMVERKKGAIINISSASALQPTPLLTEYSASKAYVDFFSEALQAEVANKGVTVQSVLPFFVATKMSGIRRTNFMVPSPETYVRAAVATIGVQQRTNGCLSHAIQGWVVDLVPHWLYCTMGKGPMLAAKAKYFKRLQKSE